MGVIDTLRAKALEVKNEVMRKANTALRIGTLLEDIVNYIGGFGSMAGVDDVTEENKQFARTTDGWSEVQTTGSSGYITVLVSENYEATQTSGDIILKCTGAINITLPTITTAKFTIINTDGALKTIINSVNGNTNDTLEFLNSSITLVNIGSGNYERIN